MQHTLTFKHDNKKYVSKPFDFEAMCIINDAHNDENKNGPLNIAERRWTICSRERTQRRILLMPLM